MKKNRKEAIYIAWQHYTGDTRWRAATIHAFKMRITEPKWKWALPRRCNFSFNFTANFSLLISSLARSLSMFLFFFSFHVPGAVVYLSSKQALMHAFVSVNECRRCRWNWWRERDEYERTEYLERVLISCINSAFPELYVLLIKWESSSQEWSSTH